MDTPRYSLKDVLKLIPTDNLHWNEEDKKYVLLSDQEMTSVLEAAAKVHPVDGHLFLAVRWAEECRAGELLLKAVLEGRVGLANLNRNGIDLSQNTTDDIIPIPLLEVSHDDTGKDDNSSE